jgi:hypothetical protein
MEYTTCYTSHNGQPSNNHQTHNTMESALDSWLSNCGAVQTRGGGNSMLRDSKGRELVWLEKTEEAYTTGLLALEYDMDTLEVEDADTPEKVHKHISKILTRWKEVIDETQRVDVQNKYYW